MVARRGRRWLDGHEASVSVAVWLHVLALARRRFESVGGLLHDRVLNAYAVLAHHVLHLAVNGVA